MLGADQAAERYSTYKMPADMKEHADISEHMSDIEDDTENGQHDETMADAETTGGQAEVKKKYDPKDPSRPRRKKARRACFACQRAHLTCGVFIATGFENV